MKLFAALGCCLLSCVGLHAQMPGRLAPPAVPAGGTRRVVSQPVVAKSAALGGNFASPVISRPLGGIGIPALPNLTPARRRRSVPGTSSGYVGPIYYVPNAYDTVYDPGIAYPPPLPPQLSGAPPQPIIINQYFGSKAARTEIDGDGAATAPEQPAVAPGDPLAPPENYYLIAYKNHTVYSAMAYWLEGETLHYVTLQNTHNQASLGLIDLEQTTKLNRDRSVPFSIAAN
jgi:hypothetical protein